MATVSVSQPQRFCPHGRSYKHDLTGHPHRKELKDPNDFGIMEFYSACDCCGIPMHTDSPFPGGGILQKDQTLRCVDCNDDLVDSDPL